MIITPLDVHRLLERESTNESVSVSHATAFESLTAKPFILDRCIQVHAARVSHLWKLSTIVSAVDIITDTFIFQCVFNMQMRMSRPNQQFSLRSTIILLFSCKLAPKI